MKKALPTATVLSFDDYPQAFLALQQGKVIAVTTDESILAGYLWPRPRNKEKFEIPNIQISDEPYGLGMRKGDKNFVEFRQRDDPGDGEERRGQEDLRQVVRPEHRQLR